MKIEHWPIRYRKQVPEKFGTKLHVRHARNWSWDQFLAPISGTCVIGITGQIPFLMLNQHCYVLILETVNLTFNYTECIYKTHKV